MGGGLTARVRRGLCALLAALPILACEPTAAPVPAASPLPAPAYAQAAPVFAWRAQVGASTLHLLGSVHVARESLYPLDPRIEVPFAASDVLVLEVALDEAAQLDAARRMLELGRLAPGKRLSDVVSRETWNLLVESQERRGQPLFGLRGFRPWLVAMTLTTQALEAQGFSAEHGIDEHFRRAAVGHKRIEALETVDGQLALFASLSAEAEEQLLRQTLEELDAYGAELDAAFRLWSSGDASGIDRLMVSPMQTEYPDLFRRLFADRNHAMTERLLELAETPGRYFIVVGAGHLVGNTGVLALLAARGIASEQL